MFLLRLLGGASLEDASGPLSGRAAQRRRLALLAILALEQPRAVGRDKLVAWLWPEHDTERARHLLRDSLYLLRNALGDDSLLSTGDELRLNPQVVRCDVWEFEEALGQERREAAVRAYAGPLLDGFHVRDAAELERWLDAERERLARAYATALEQLAEEATARGDARAAVEWWRRVAAGDPYNSRVTLRLMEALEATGDRAGALQQARVHTVLLEQEFETQPASEVAALAERLRTRSAWPPLAAPAPPVPTRQFREPPPPPPVVNASHLPATAPGSPPSNAPGSPQRRFGTRAVVLPAATALGGAVVFALIWLLPGTGLLQSAATETVVNTKAIAVLPCTNPSRDPDEEYFSDGLTEELIGVLSQVRALQVVARTSVFAFKGENRDIREIGEALGVGTLLECNVRQSGERVRVTAQLINAADGFHLWSEMYEHEGTDVFAIQSDLALQIMSALEAELTPAERARLARRPTASPEAHVLYLKGRHFWNQRTRSAFARAIEYFERAIEVDPQYAAAYAGLATTYSLQGLGGDLTPLEANELTRKTALKALNLDDELAEAHTVLGGYFHAHAWDSQAAEREHLRALELDPNYSTGRHWYGNLLTSMGRLDEAIAQKRKAVELDPLTPQPNNSLGYTLLDAGRPDQAYEAFRTVLELDSMYWQAHAGLGTYYETTDQLEEAVRAHRRAVELAGTNSNARAGLARALALAGRADEARMMLGELQAEADRTGLYTPVVAWVFDALDDVDGTLEWLERSYRQRHPGLRFIDRPRASRLADDPRFLDLLRRIGLQ